MELRVGIVNSAKETEIELDTDTDVDELRSTVEKLLTTGKGVLWLKDTSGRQVAIVASSIAYVDFGRPSSRRSVGFSTG